MHTRSLPVIRHFTARPRLMVSVLVGFAIGALLPSDLPLATRFLIAWNGAVVLYLALALAMMAGSDEPMMRQRAAIEDDGKLAVLALAILAALVSLVAIGVELLIIKDAADAARWPRVALSAGTILTSWTFIHVIFTQHYAHEFYSERHADAAGHMVHTGGLAFPGDEPPAYIDFSYFSFTIGVANQTADISITSREMRKLALIHSVLSYLFNTTILALTINIATSQF